MLTSGLATSEFTSSQYIGDTENQSNLSPRKYFILNCKLIYILTTECKTSALSIIWWRKLLQFRNFANCKFIHISYQTVLARTSTLRSAGGDDDLIRWFLCWVFRWKKLNVVPWKSRARKSRAGKLKSCQKIHVRLECWSRAGVTADLDAPRIWTPPQSKFVSGYGSHFANLDPPTELSF